MFLFKYVSLNPKTQDREHTLDILKNNQLFLGFLTKFNDPYDCQHAVDLSGMQVSQMPQDLRDEAILRVGEAALNAGFQTLIQDEKMMREVREKWESDLPKIIDSRMGITCFSGENRKASMLMWAHYADKHKGICLQFLNGKPIENNLRRVKYVAVPMTVRPFQKMTDEEKKAHGVDMLSTKSVMWDYEDEYRMIMTLGDDSRAVKFPPALLVGVQFGLATSAEDRADVIRILHEKKYPGVKIYETVKNREKFDVYENQIGEVNYMK